MQAELGLRPFLSIWTSPRVTIRGIVDTDPNRHVLWLVVVSGFLGVLNRAAAQGLGDELTTAGVFLLAAVMSPLGILFLYVGGMLLQWVGAQLGGVASRAQVRSAIAWSSVPFTTWSLLLWPLELAVFGGGVFSKSTPTIDPALLVLIGIGGLTVLVWGTIVHLHCLGEVHRFSAWKALWAVVLATLVIAGPPLLLVLFVAFLQAGLR
jgi:hypothetical protein